MPLETMLHPPALLLQLGPRLLPRHRAREKTFPRRRGRRCLRRVGRWLHGHVAVFERFPPPFDGSCSFGFCACVPLPGHCQDWEPKCLEFLPLLGRGRSSRRKANESVPPARVWSDLMSLAKVHDFKLGAIVCSRLSQIIIQGSDFVVLWPMPELTPLELPKRTGRCATHIFFVSMASFRREVFRHIEGCVMEVIWQLLSRPTIQHLRQCGV
mmetsp:Transcript_38062/g.83002  ORF Transcript_38062/g.83002 Transcript_38062/m.83002 type:complete len:212 (-) Transcript_38062:1063-1698(-)